MIINKEEFKIMKGTISRSEVSKQVNAGKTIYDCYTRPSTRKMYIWEYWNNWFIDQEAWLYGVKSYNSNIFTITGMINHKGTLYYVVITPTRQEVTLVEN